MSAGWAAGSLRARDLARRRLGAGAARQLASSPSLRDAQRALAATTYADRVGPGQDLAATQHGIADTLLWDLRVLAGWLPPDGVRLLRVLAAWFEIANVDEMLQILGGRPAGPEFRLGTLATAWPRLRRAGSRSGLRAALTASDWRDPGGDTDHTVRLAMRERYAARAARLGEPVLSWAAGALAVLVAGELSTGSRAGRAVPGDAPGLLGPAAAGAVTLAELAGQLPPSARWVLAGISGPADLWRAEVAVRDRIERDGQRLLRGTAPDSRVVLGAVAVMACDMWRVRAALEVAARGGVPLEAYDELA